MKLGVISDTHGEDSLTRQAILIYKELGVERIVHCGDLGTPATIELFREIPTDFVFGNSDGSATRTFARKIEEIGGRLHDWFGSIEIESKKIAFLHGHEERRLDQEINSQRWDLICFGHRHWHSLTEIGKTLVLNPGSIQRRLERPSFCCVDLPELSVSRFSL